MLNFKKNTLWLIICIIKSSASFGAGTNEDQIAAEFIRLTAGSSLSFCAGFALGSGEINSALAATLLTADVIRATPINQRQAYAALFTAYSIMGITSGATFSYLSKKRRAS